MKLSEKLFKWLQLMSPWLLAAYWLVLFTATHIPTTGTLPTSDKVLHFGAYFVLAFLFATFLFSRGTATRRLIVMTISILFAFAVFDELTQQLVGRHCDPMDALADWVGVVCGLGAFAACRKLVFGNGSQSV